MKKILSGILAIMIAGASALTVFAADITADEVTITVDGQTETMTDALKASAYDEEGMLRISPETLVKIKLKLEDESGKIAEEKDMSFIAHQMITEDNPISKDTIQFIDEKTTDSDGTVTIQFRPRESQPVGIYNMRASTRGASIFSKYYKTVANEIQPVLSNASRTPKNEDIEITVTGYTEAWKAANTLNEVKTGEDGAEAVTPIDTGDYSFEKGDDQTNIVTLKIKTKGDWATEGEHTFRFIPDNTAYNPITFMVTITGPLKDYTIKFNGDEFEAKTFNERTIPSDGLELPTPVKNGYDFDGWYKEAAYTNQVTSPVTVADIATIFGAEETEITLYAKWTPTKYSITYMNMDGAQNPENAPVEYTIVDQTITLPTPTKPYYSFDGWYEDEGFTEPKVTEIPAGSTGSKEFYAKWTPITYTLNLDPVDGILNGGVVSPITFTIEDLAKPEYSLPTASKENYNFTGWYTAQTEGTLITKENVLAQLFTSATENTVYARYVEKGRYTVAYDAGEGVGAPDSQEYYYNTNPTVEIAEEEPTRNGYTFVGWKVDGDDSDTVYKYNTENNIYTVPDENTILVKFIAQWTPVKYNIYYELNGGTNYDDAPETYTIEDEITLGTPTYAGCNFEGWYSEQEFTNVVTQILRGSTGDKTFYAKWSEQDTSQYRINSFDPATGIVNVRKRTEDKVYVILAFYKTVGSNNGVLVQAKISELTEQGDSVEKTFSDIPENYTYAKVFIWDSLNHMEPVCDSVTFNNQ